MDWLARIIPSKPQELSEDQPWRVLGRRISKLILPMVFLACLTFLTISTPVFLTWQNLSNVSRQVAVVGLLSLGQLAVMLTGNIDLSSASLMGLFGAVLAGQSKEMGFPLALGMAVVLALVWGFSNGFLVTRGKNISVIVTLSTMYIAQGLLLIYTQGRPVILFPMPYEFLGIGSLGPIPWSLIALSLVALVMALVLRFAPVGRHVYAVGGNRDRRQAPDRRGVRHQCNDRLIGQLGVTQPRSIGTAECRGRDGIGQHRRSPDWRCICFRWLRNCAGNHYRRLNSGFHQ